MNTMEKSAELTAMLTEGGRDKEFQVKFAEIGTDYIQTKVREDSIAEKILDVRNLSSADHPQIQRDVSGSDTFYWYEDIEEDAIAMEVAMRAESVPTWVDGKVYTIPIGKIATEKKKKPKMELLVAKNLVRFIRENNADAIRRMQDTIFMRTVRAGLGLTASVMGADSTDFSTYAAATAMDWTTGAKPQDLVNLKNMIVRKELKPARWLMSEAAYGVFSTIPADEIGDMAGTSFTDGFDKNLLSLPTVRTIKSTLADNLTGNRFFDHVVAGDGVYSDIYLFTDSSYLGRLIKVFDDAIWSEWVEDIFHWNSWRYCGLGFGDVRGIAMMRVRLQDLS